MNNWIDPNIINSVFNKYITPWRSFDRANASKEFCENVLNKVDEIFQYVLKYNIDWENDTMENILQKLEWT